MPRRYPSWLAGARLSCTASVGRLYRRVTRRSLPAQVLAAKGFTMDENTAGMIDGLFLGEERLMRSTRQVDGAVTTTLRLMGD
jgi:hypothetical protein